MRCVCMRKPSLSRMTLSLPMLIIASILDQVKQT